jgi:hypothetical protein
VDLTGSGVLRSSIAKPLRTAWRLGVMVAFTIAVAAPLFAVTATEIHVVSGTAADGAPTELWLEILRRRSSEETVAAAAALRRPPTDQDRAWEELIRARARIWKERLGALVAPFRPLAPPERIRIVLGNRGAEDAFTHDRITIGFDVSRLEALFGSAHDLENRDRIDRFFDHETTHLLQKAWLAEHPPSATTPFERAELDIWLEGLGNYYSLSQRWRAHDGTQSAAARTALDELEPILVTRMAKLACASEEEADRLLANLSQGPFTKKWGALPAALWLEAESSRDPHALRDFVQVGPAGVRELARRHLLPRLADDLDRARARSESCGRRDD